MSTLCPPFHTHLVCGFDAVATMWGKENIHNTVVRMQCPPSNPSIVHAMAFRRVPFCYSQHTHLPCSNKQIHVRHNFAQRKKKKQNEPNEIMLLTVIREYVSL